jgi:hypothetical protein
MSVPRIVFGPVGAFVILHIDEDQVLDRINICIDEIVQTWNSSNPLVALLIPKTTY